MQKYSKKKDDEKINIFVHNKTYHMEFSLRDIGR
jgi:hypothetical protein